MLRLSSLGRGDHGDKNQSGRGVSPLLSKFSSSGALRQWLRRSCGTQQPLFLPLLTFGVRLNADLKEFPLFRRLHTSFQHLSHP